MTNDTALSLGLPRCPSYRIDSGGQRAHRFTKGRAMFRSASTTELDELRSLALFASCSNKELASIARLSTRVTIASGETIVRQGDMSTDCYAILDGTARAEIDGVRIADFGPGESFGELSPIDRQPRSASVVATTDLTALVFTGDNFAKIASTIPSLTKKILSEMTLRLRTVQV
jgi:CRP/FNR family transcriptional regulator, cyclic AMP receptor protein